MTNVLKMVKQQAIIGLLEQGWSLRRIARELGIDRETVSRYNKLRISKPAISTPGSKPPVLAKPAISTPGSPGRVSLCNAFGDAIQKKLDQGLTAQRIYQDLCQEHGFTGSYSSVKRFVMRLGAATPLPFRRIEVEPGSEAQVDFGAGGWILQDGRKRRVHLFRITLSHSRKSYSEPVERQTTELFIRALENAFRYWGGVPKTLVIDNLRAAVRHADRYDPELNPKIMEFARYYGTVILPTKPYTPRHKGKIESGIKYVKSNALKGRVFDSLAEQRQFLLHWEATVADTRIHGTTKRQVRQIFEEIERPVLTPLPPEPFPVYHEGRRRVHRDAHVEVDKSYYSVPPEYLGRPVWVRWDTRLVRVFNDNFEQIALHAKTAAGRFATDRTHLCDQKISGVERGVHWLLDKIHYIGPYSHRWAAAMLEQRGIEGVRVLQGFAALTRKYPASSIERASRLALQTQLFRLRPLRKLITRIETQSELEFAEDHEIIRPLSTYQELLTGIAPSEKPQEPQR